MRTKRTKAANVRIGDVLYGIGTVDSIIHLDRNTLDITAVVPNYGYRLVTRAFDDIVEVVIPEEARHTLCKVCGKSLGWNGHAYSDCK